MKKLTKKQLAKQRAENRAIRKAWQSTDGSVDYKTFKKIVKGYVKGGKYDTIKEAAKKYAHSTRFVTRSDIGKENILAGVKSEFPDVYKEIRSKMGKFKKGEHMADRLVWDKNMDAWKFTSSSNQTYYIMTDNSPKDVYIV